MSQQKIELGLNLEDLKKMQEILKSCEASAERIAALAPTIQQFHTGAVPGELAAFSEEPGIYADLREAQWLLNAENHIANMMGLYWIKAIIRARCHAEGVPIAFNSEEEKGLASAKHSGAVSNETEIHINPIAIDEYIKAVSGGGESAYPTGKQCSQVSTKMARDLAESAERVSIPGVNKTIKTTAQEDATKLDVPATDKQQADAWFKIWGLLNELRPGWSCRSSEPIVVRAMEVISKMASESNMYVQSRRVVSENRQTLENFINHVNLQGEGGYLVSDVKMKLDGDEGEK